MPPRPLETKRLDPDVFDTAASGLRALHARLPEDAVQSLAREVLERVASRGPAATGQDGQVKALASALVDENPDLCLEMIVGLQASGHSVEDLYLNFLAPAARRLGELWTLDRLSFAEVTFGTARIYGLLHALDVPVVRDWAGDQPAALFIAVPGEEHTLGVRMAADLFRRRDWQIDLILGRDHDEIIEKFSRTQHYLVGVSASTTQDLTPLARLIVALRSVRPGVRILVSGKLVSGQGDLVETLCPDGVGTDFDSAFTALTRLWHSLAPENR